MKVPRLLFIIKFPHCHKGGESHRLICITTLSIIIQRHDSIFLVAFAGTPATTVFSGTSFVTTAPAATTALSQIVTPGNIVALDPIHTLSPLLTGKVYGVVLLSNDTPSFIVAIVTFIPNHAPSPILIPPLS